MSQKSNYNHGSSNASQHNIRVTHNPQGNGGGTPQTQLTKQKTNRSQSLGGTLTKQKTMGGTLNTHSQADYELGNLTPMTNNKKKY